VNFTVHDPLERVHEVWSKVPAPEADQDTVPLGVEPVPGDVSVTVAVHEVGEPLAGLDGVQVSEVDVLRLVTVNWKK
jgi:hypothetical protein